MSSKRIFTFVLVIAIVSSFFALPVFGAGQNLIKNGGFENMTKSMPTDWSTTTAALASGISVAAVTTDVHNGKQSLNITNGKPADTMVIQNVTVEQDKLYKLTFWLKTENIKNKPGSPNITLYYGDNGAKCKGILSSAEIMDTAGKWQQVSTFFQTLKDVSIPLTVAIRVGGQGTANEGAAYFDDVSLSLVDKADAGAKILTFYVPGNNTSSSNTTTSATSSKPIDLKVPLFIVLGIVALGILIYVEMKLSKRSKTNDVDSEEEDSDSKKDSDDTEADDTDEDTDDTDDDQT